MIGPLVGVAVRFGGLERSFLISTPTGVCHSATVRSVSLQVQLSSSPHRSKGPVKGRLVFVIVFPQAFFPIKMEGLSGAMIFIYGRIMVLGELLMA